MKNRHRSGMTIREVLIILVCIVVMAVLLLPGLARVRRVSRKITNTTQLRGIHQGCVTFSAGSKKATGDGPYPGLKSDGTLVTEFTWPTANGTFTAGKTVHGAEPATRFTVMLNKSYFTPEYLINPMDAGREGGKRLVHPIGTSGVDDKVVSPDNFSYAMLRIDEPSEGRRAAWAETISANEVVLSDRNIGPGSGAGQAASVWTGVDSGEWEGTVVFNDGSVSYVIPSDNGYDTPTLAKTRYGDEPYVEDDNLFADDDPMDVTLAGSNAAMVFQDATTMVDQH